jgi:hypothetical protein
VINSKTSLKLICLNEKYRQAREIPQKRDSLRILLFTLKFVINDSPFHWIAIFI